MELKSAGRSALFPTRFCFNCTFMELKWSFIHSASLWMAVLIVPLWNWNKQTIRNKIIVHSFNCTFMELKWFCRAHLPVARRVLIVPLWNWNSLPRPCFVSARSFNCTFMELKYKSSRTWRTRWHSFNCTFMELKWRLRVFRVIQIGRASCRERV